MSREIKFRAWDKEKSKWCNTGNLQLEIGGFSGLYWQFGYSTEPLTKKSCNNYHLMQYTGLKDKNGVEIYEGDIVTELGAIKVVEWTDEGAGWQFRTVKDEPGNYSAKVEVIGNLYENPELIKKELK